ncbi:MAG: hypothetical protein GY787_28275 [Alteromonadales bacterium]|nr:hypothetical protein [Alteromonadales bacterium]
MTISLKKLLDNFISKYSIKSAEDFINIIDSNETYLPQIIEASMCDRNVYFEKNTFDGWYCIEKSSDIFNVYYQERGRIEWVDEIINGKSKAVTEVLLLSHCMRLTKQLNGTKTVG